MFETLGSRLQSVFDNLQKRGKLTEADVDIAMREVRLALLEADVNFKVVKDFVARVRERSIGQEVMRSLTPGQQVVKIVNDELIRTLGEPGRLNLGAQSPAVIMLVGLQGAGKTTMLRALASEIPPSERIVTIESEMELGLERFEDLHPDCVALEAREANVEGVGEVTAADLVRMSLRMNPDRVIVGEVRGDEVIPMLNAMSQGNDGSMCTVHADSSATVFNKMALYAMQSPERLPLEATCQLAAAAVDLVVFIAKSRHGRWVSSVRQVVGVEGSQVITNELFRPGPDGRAVPGVPIPHDLGEELAAHGWDQSLHDRPEVGVRFPHRRAGGGLHHRDASPVGELLLVLDLVRAVAGRVRGACGRSLDLVLGPGACRGRDRGARARPRVAGAAPRGRRAGCDHAAHIDRIAPRL